MKGGIPIKTLHSYCMQDCIKKNTIFMKKVLQTPKISCILAIAVT